MAHHSEISPVILSSQALNYFLFAYDVSIKATKRKKTKSVAVSVAENEYSTSAILLQTTSLEGYVNRVLYLLSQIDTAYLAYFDKVIEDKIKIILKTSTQVIKLSEEFDEVLVVRNAIAHAHIYQTNRRITRTITKSQALILQQNARWKRVVDQKNNFRTVKLGINAIPSEVRFDDAKKVFIFWRDLYNEIEKLHGQDIAYLPPIYPYIYVKFHQADTALRKKVNAAHTPDGSLSGWINFA